REAAELIAAVDLAPRNLRVAAGLGRPDLLDELVRPDGGLAPAAGAHRGFYRPHTGFPTWRPSDDPHEILDEGLGWAAKSGRPDAARPRRRPLGRRAGLQRHAGAVGRALRARGRPRAAERYLPPQPSPARGEGVREPSGRAARVSDHLLGGAEAGAEEAAPGE